MKKTIGVFEESKFSMAEIADAFGVKPYFEGGISYGVLKLDIPFNGAVIKFRDGDDEKDHSIEKVYSEKNNWR